MQTPAYPKRKVRPDEELEELIGKKYLPMPFEAEIKMWTDPNPGDGKISSTVRKVIFFATDKELYSKEPSEILAIPSQHYNPLLSRTITRRGRTHTLEISYAQLMGNDLEGLDENTRKYLESIQEEVHEFYLADLDQGLFVSPGAYTHMKILSSNKI